MNTKTIQLTPREAFKKRHAETVDRLQRLVGDKEKTTGLSENAMFSKVANALDLVPQTVRNYRSGDGGDGFMLEAIISEFEKL